MTRLSVLAVLSLLIIVNVIESAIVPQAKPFDASRDVTLPVGFVIEKIAGAPLVKHPLHITFDEQGRAYVTEMAGVNRNGKELEKELPNGIKRLIDTDGDGKFDNATMFADKMTFPGGILWHQGAIYTTSFPSLWKLVDTNGDGIADERTPLISSFGSIGNAADLHGPQLGPDGWLYFCDGRNGHDVKQADGTALKGKASGLYRCKPDGTGFERLFAGGMDNPVEVAFGPAGEPFVCTNLVLNNPRHDGILLGIDGAVYPYDLKAVREVKWTGQYLPIMGELGWVATSSLAEQRTSAWGPSFQGKYLEAEFNTHGVRLLTFNRQGASFTMKAEPFLTCNHPDFHPTQLVAAADGSIILVDTGGWFRNGCPTSQVAKPQVQGGIYRIRKTTQPKKGDFAVRTEVANKETLLKQTTSDVATQRLAALWSLSRMLVKGNDIDVQAAFRVALDDKNIDVVVTALHIVGQYEDIDAGEAVVRLLEHNDLAVRREAAQTLGRLKYGDAASALLQALVTAEDPFLEHAILYSLIRLKQSAPVINGLLHESTRVQRGALIVLDQLSALSWEHVAPLLQSSEAKLKQTTLEVVAKYPQWVNDLVDYVDRDLTRKQHPEPKLAGIRNLLIGLAAQPRVQQFIADRLVCPEEPGNTRYMLLEAMAGADLAAWPNLWEGPLLTFLSEPKLDNELLLQGILVAGVSKKRNCDALLRSVAESSDRPIGIRLAAAVVALQDGKPIGDSLFAKLLAATKPGEEPTVRLTASRALSVALLNPDQLIQLATQLRTAGAMELPLLISPWERQTDADRVVLLQSLDKAPALAAIPLDRLQKLFEKLPVEQQSHAHALLQKGRPDLAAQKTRLEQLKPILTGGDIKKGRELFFGTKAICSTCHRIGNDGGLIGPNLSTIGKIRTRSDLLESILFPNASLARGYESMVVTTKDGRTLTGVLTRESAEALTLTNSQRLEQKVLRSQIDEMTASQVSTMPAGMDQTLTTEELQHLLAYLESLKK
jgi:putative membrane-bound dehydrogenase-like protein